MYFFESFLKKPTETERTDVGEPVFLLPDVRKHSALQSTISFYSYFSFHFYIEVM